MATATMTAASVSKPPSPHLGNFREIFDAFLKLQTDPEFKFELERKLSAEEKAKEKAKIKGLVKNELLQTPGSRVNGRRSPRMTEACRLLHDGVIGEFVPNPPQAPADAADAGNDVTLAQARGATLSPIDIGKAVVFDSPSNGSVSTLNSVSLGSLHYSTTATTPPGSADKTGTATSTNIVFDNSTSSVGIPNDNGAALPATSRVVASNYGAAPSPRSENPFYFPLVPWSTLRFRVDLLKTQPYKDVKLYAILNRDNQEGVVPHYMASKEDKTKVMKYKLAPTLEADQALKERLPAASKPIHVFVDLSNITIGFYDCLKLKHGIPVTRKMKAPPFSFEHLSLLLERGRAAEKKIVAGSLINTYNRRWPEYMQEAKELGYEMNILQRVPKATPSPTERKTRRGGNGETGWTTSGAESSGEEVFIGQLKQGEQGVDELLHLKMLQSALDSEPGTVVLATGDAAEAEYSDGFKKNVERLLQNGWNVEIVGWSKGISSAWRDPTFVKTWGDRVRLIELDLFTEELFAAWFGAPGY